MSCAGAVVLRIACLLSLAAAAAGHAAPVGPDRNATGTARITNPAELRNLQELNFAYLSVTAAGTAIVDPDTDMMSTTGGVLHAAGTPYAALYEAVSPLSGVIIVRLPEDPILVTRIGGTETMTVSDWTISGGGPIRTVVALATFEFKVGGTLYVEADQVEGTYVGTFSVDIEFP